MILKKKFNSMLLVIVLIHIFSKNDVLPSLLPTKQNIIDYIYINN